MSHQSEPVREMLPIGIRMWIKCDGCGVKGPVLDRKLAPEERAVQPWGSAKKITGWTCVQVIGQEGKQELVADLCPKCVGMRIEDALDRVRK